MDLSDLTSDLCELLQSDNGCEYTDIEDGRITNLDCKLSINFLHLNIRSFQKNKDALVMLLNDLQKRGIIIHAIGLCETYLTAASKGIAHLENYQSIHHVRSDKVGGGTSLFVHDKLKIFKSFDLPFSDCFEITAAVVQHGNKRIFLADFYRPPNTNDADFDIKLRELIDVAANYDTSLIGCDQNYDLLKIDQHKQTRDFLSAMYDANYLPMILKPTRITHRSSTLIDNIFVRNKQMSANKSFVVVDGMSDHYPCLLMYELHQKGGGPDLFFEKRKLTEDVIKKIQQSLLFHDWSDMYSMNVNDAYSYLINVINGMLDTHAPKKVIVIKHDEKFREAWLTVWMLKYNQKCHKLCNKARKTGKEDDHKFYRAYRNALNRIKLHEKRQHYKQLFDKIGKNSKLLWNVVNGIVKKTNNRHSVTELLYSSKLCTRESEICNAFNSHFGGAGLKVQRTVDQIKEDPCKYLKKIGDKMKFHKVTEMQVCKIVMNMRPKTSSSVDGISNALLKDLVHVIKGPLCDIFNKSLSTGVFPELMKVAKVQPLHKGGDPIIPDNYRPISLLPVISKVLEKIVYTRVVAHLENNKILYTRQFGFRKKFSTIDTIHNFTNEVLQAFECGNFMISVFIDLKKAFDSMSHEILVKKLEAIGVGDTELSWFKNYLSSRKQLVVLGRSESQMAGLEVGVAQGSLLGVLMFQIFINDLWKCLKYSTSILYADDTTIFLVGKSIRFLRAKLQADLDALSIWLRINRLKLNVSKTKCMIMNREGLQINVDLFVDNQPIQCVYEFRFLGVIIDCALTFNPHFKSLYDKLYKACYVIRFLGSTLPTSCLRTLYFAYFHSHLTYGLAIWYPLLSKAAQNNLYLLQKRLIRYVNKSNFREHCMPLFKLNEILTISDQLKLENCKVIYRVTHGLIAKPIINCYSLSSGNRTCNAVSIHKHSLSIVNKSILCKPITDWRSLPSDFKTKESLYSFCRALKVNLLDWY